MKSEEIPVEGTNLKFYTTNDDNGWGYVVTPTPVNEKNSDNGFDRKDDAQKAAITKAKEIYARLN
jgi:hypothetical protein